METFLGESALDSTPTTSLVAPTTTDTAPGIRCVDGRQTEDPLSPPCVNEPVPIDNGGSTSDGVTADEIRVAVTSRVNCESGEPTLGCPPHGPAYDVGSPPVEGALSYDSLRMSWALQEYFNRRYQMYGRRLHLFTMSAEFATSTASWRRPPLRSA